MAAPPYARFDQPGAELGTAGHVTPTMMVVPASDACEPPVSRTKRIAAIVCGTLQVVCGVLFFCLAVSKVVKKVPVFGVHGFLGCIFSILAGSFGIQSGRTGGKCPAIASMVLSILGSIVFFSGFFYNVRLSVAADVANERLYDTILNNTYFSVGSRALYVIMIVCCLINFITAIVQAAFACAMVCSCCRTKAETTSVVMAGNVQIVPTQNANVYPVSSDAYAVNNTVYAG